MEIFTQRTRTYLCSGKVLLIFCCGLLICSPAVRAQEQETKGIKLGETQSASAGIKISGDDSPAFSFASAPNKDSDSSLAKINDLSAGGDSVFALETFPPPKTVKITHQFELSEEVKRDLGFDAAADSQAKKIAFTGDQRAKDDGGEPRYMRETAAGKGFNYGAAFTQSLVFLGVQHGYAIAAQEKTRRALREGPFWRDYADSVKALRGWDDGGRFFTNYLAHPMQGAFTGFIYVQNSPEALREQFSASPKYVKTRLKAMLWTTAWSTQFEIGPLSQASIGNVGLSGKQTWEDVVVTPTLGTAWLVGEDALDRFVIKGIERRTNNRYVKIFSRMLLNPTRNFSNLLRLREPWYRDRPPAR